MLDPEDPEFFDFVIFDFVITEPLEFTDSRRPNTMITLDHPMESKATMQLPCRLRHELTITIRIL